MNDVEKKILEHYNGIIDFANDGEKQEALLGLLSDRKNCDFLVVHKSETDVEDAYPLTSLLRAILYMGVCALVDDVHGNPEDWGKFPVTVTGPDDDDTLH